MRVPPNLHLLTTSQKYRFAAPHPHLLAQYRRLEALGLPIDLIYAPVMFQALQEHPESIRGPLLYVHTGGLTGNATMLQRYGL